MRKDEFPIVDKLVKDSINEVLDKIRAEIQENINYNKKMNYPGIVAGLLLTLDIIDKYRESEKWVKFFHPKKFNSFLKTYRIKTELEMN